MLVTRDGEIATVTLNNPARLNALNKPTYGRAARRDALALVGDESLRCVVLRGAGDKAFAAGADISEFAPECAMRRQAKSSANSSMRRCRPLPAAGIRQSR